MCTYKTSLTGHSPSSLSCQDAHNQSLIRDILLTLVPATTGNVLKVCFLYMYIFTVGWAFVYLKHAGL